MKQKKKKKKNQAEEEKEVTVAEGTVIVIEIGEHGYPSSVVRT